MIIDAEPADGGRSAASIVPTDPGRAGPNPGPPSDFVRVRETHTAVVLLAGDRAFKFKKPVDLGFLDFSTAARRSQACARELSLNRRMAPDVYLGPGRFEQVGRPPETAVVMRRMPDERRLSALVRGGVPVTDELRDLGRDLAAFHARATRHPLLERAASRDAVLARWRESIEQVRQLHDPDSVVAEGTRGVAVLVERFLAGRESLFQQRISSGRVVDGHGDLQADDVFCLVDGPRALDCLEFDDALRHVDGLDDAAFLAMDLEHLGFADLGSAFLDSYAAFAGDPAPASLRHHYIAYRAFVRAKVALLRVRQGDLESGHAVESFTRIAHRHLRLGEVRLILLGGLPGTGKSTLAGLLGDAHGYAVLSSDRVRKELAGVPSDAPVPTGFGDGIYSAAMTEATYDELVRRASLLLAVGESVILDASWTDVARRAPAVDLATTSSAELTELRCQATTDMAAARMRDRVAGASDADDRIAAQLARIQSGWPSATVIDTNGGPAESLAQATAALRRSPTPRASRHPTGSSCVAAW